MSLEEEEAYITCEIRNNENVLKENMKYVPLEKVSLQVESDLSDMGFKVQNTSDSTVDKTPEESTSINNDDNTTTIKSVSQMAEMTERLSKKKIAEVNLRNIEAKRLKDMHEIEMLKQKEERLIREKEKSITRSRVFKRTRTNRQRQRELELQIKACDDRIAQDERHVKEEEDQMKDLKDRIHHDAVKLKTTNDIIESKKKLKAVENKRLEDMHEIEMLKQKEERLIREKEKLRAHGIQTDADKQRQRELELQIKACDDRIAQDERHVKEEEDQMKDLKDRIHHDAVKLKTTNDIIESKKKLKAVENKRLEDMHEIEMLKQKEETN